MENVLEKRSRSPNYPALSLPDAIEKVTVLYKNLHTHSAPREVVAKGMGYQSLSGASATAISALAKYGLIERSGEELKVSERALRIIHPNTPTERSEAINEAARDPALFSELFERFDGRMPNEDLLRNYLARKSFVPAAISMIVLGFRETLEFVRQESSVYDSPRVIEPENTPMSSPIGTQQAVKAPPVVPQALALSEDERPIGRYDFEDGSYVRIIAGGDVDTEAALDMVETLIDLKRKELVKRKQRQQLSHTRDNDHEEKGNDETNFHA